MQHVMKAEPYRCNAMGSFGDARYMLIRQYQFPDVIDPRDVFVDADHDRCIQWDYEHAMDCFKRHTGTGDMGLEYWARGAKPEAVIAFLRDILKADEHHAGTAWTGFRILGTVNVSNGYPVWSLSLYAKHPESRVKVYSDGNAANVDWHEYSRTKNRETARANGWPRVTFKDLED